MLHKAEKSFPQHKKQLSLKKSRAEVTAGQQDPVPLSPADATLCPMFLTLCFKPDMQVRGGGATELSQAQNVHICLQFPRRIWLSPDVHMEHRLR